MWVEIRTPVSLWAMAAALRTISWGGVIPPRSLATLIIPALIPVPSIPSCIYRMKWGAMALGVDAAKSRGTAKWLPVQAII